MKQLVALFILCLCLLSFTVPFLPTASARPGMSDERFARLAKGVNLPLWFWYGPTASADILTRFDPAEFVQLRRIGLTFVRVPINLPFVYDENQASLLNDAHMALLESGIAQIHVAGLAVIIDIHSTSLEDSDAADYSAKLENADFAERFIAFWSAFAARLSRFDPEFTVFGPMNEPVFADDPAAWFPLQERLIRAIRASAPEHTIIATGPLWSGMGELMSMTPLDDPNIVYDFHFYDPFPFTHQGATWTGTAVEFLRGVPYPSSPALIAPLLEGESNPQVREMLLTYGAENWNADRIRDMVGDVVWWAGQYDLRLICSEFGAIRGFTEPAYRARWITDVREILEEHGIGWAMWDYDANFGMALRSDSGKVTLDELIVEALGLNFPTQ